MQASAPSRINLNDDLAIGAVVLANPAFRVEIADGRVLFSPLTGTETAPKELEAALQLANYAKVAGGKAYGPSAGFRLPDKSLLGPDAAWLSPQRLNAALRAKRRARVPRTFWRACPDVAIEVASEWDTWASVIRKIERFVENGAGFAVAIDCERRKVVERGTPPDGLVLDYERIFDA